MKAEQETLMAGHKRSTPLSGGAERTTKRSGDWTVPKGKDVQSMTRDASRQVVKNYGEALKKLKKH
jgi:hypothetical protein